MQLEDINWDVLARSDDHIVPQQGVELLGKASAPTVARKKPRHEVKNDVGKNMCSRGSLTKTVLCEQDETCYLPIKNGSSSSLEGLRSFASTVVVPTSCDFESTATASALPYQDGRILDHCVNESNSNARSKMFCSRDPSTGRTVSTNENESYLSSFDDMPPDVTHLSLLESSQKARESDLAYYDWPDVSNFEDVDEMFR